MGGKILRVAEVLRSIEDSGNSLMRRETRGVEELQIESIPYLAFSRNNCEAFKNREAELHL